MGLWESSTEKVKNFTIISGQISPFIGPNPCGFNDLSNGNPSVFNSESGKIGHVLARRVVRCPL
jgi:hypothetical protein